jgi:hypothetical protein
VITVVRIFTRLYALLLRLYPRDFRAEFGEEMRVVLRASVSEAAERGGVSLARASFRELRTWPGAVIREHWLNMRRSTREKRMSQAIYAKQTVGGIPVAPGEADEPGSRADAVMAGLAHLLTALAMGVPGTLRELFDVSSDAEWLRVLSIALGVALLGTIVVALVVAWRRGWPRWSASYYGYGLLVVAGPVGLFLLTDALGYVVMFVLMAGLLYGAAQWNRLRGLLAALPMMILLWLPVLEFVPSPIRDQVNMGAWLLAALAAATIMRAGNWKAGVWSTVGVSLVVGLTCSFVRTYLHDLPPQYAAEPTMARLVNRFAPPFLAITTLLIGPLLARALRDLARYGKGTGTLGYRLSLAGLALDLTSNLVAFWWYTGGRRQALRPSTGDLWLTVAGYLGVALYLSGALVLCLAALRNGARPGRLASVLVVPVLLVLPVVSVLPFLYNLRSIPSGWPFGLSALNHVPRGLVYAAGIAWLLLGGWLATWRGSRPGARRA